eukprot:scaffold1946_cov188-Ochromonas_danica.AAC.12
MALSWGTFLFPPTHTYRPYRPHVLGHGPEPPEDGNAIIIPAQDNKRVSWFVTTVSRRRRGLSKNLFVVMRCQDKFYDVHKTGELTFLDFISTLWLLLTANEESLAVLCFSFFDLDMVDYLEIDEINYLIHFLWEFKPSKAAEKGLKKLRLNKDGTMTLPEFVLLCHHFPALLAPLRQLQKALRKKIIFKRFWRQIQVRRQEKFGSRTNGLKLAMRGLREGIVKQSLDYLNLRLDVVPRQYVDQYHMVQRRKASTGRGQVIWPYEIIEHYRQLLATPDTITLQGDHVGTDNPFANATTTTTRTSYPREEEEDGFDARSTSAEMSAAGHVVDIPKVLEKVLAQPPGHHIKPLTSSSMKTTTIYTPSQQQLADMHYII